MWDRILNFQSLDKFLTTKHFESLRDFDKFSVN